MSWNRQTHLVIAVVLSLLVSALTGCAIRARSAHFSAPNLQGEAQCDRFCIDAEARHLDRLVKKSVFVPGSERANYFVFNPLMTHEFQESRSSTVIWNGIPWIASDAEAQNIFAECEKQSQTPPKTLLVSYETEDEQLTFNTAANGQVTGERLDKTTGTASELRVCATSNNDVIVGSSYSSQGLSGEPIVGWQIARFAVKPQTLTARSYYVSQSLRLLVSARQLPTGVEPGAYYLLTGGQASQDLRTVPLEQPTIENPDDLELHPGVAAQNITLKLGKNNTLLQDEHYGPGYWFETRAGQPYLASVSNEPVQNTPTGTDTTGTTLSEEDKIEALKKYKELLDSGVITQEEFDQKKAQLLQ